MKWSKKALEKICNPIFEDIQENFGVIVTRSGVPAIIFTKKGLGENPIVGMYYNNEEWIPCKWDENGRFPSINTNLVQSDLDLDIVKETNEQASEV